MGASTADAPAVAAAAAADPRQPWRPSTGGMVARSIALLAIAAIVLWIPHLVPDTQLNVYSRAMVYGVVALSMNILLGYAGQVSLGHQAFVGVGAFASAYFLDKAGLPWLMSVGASVILGALIALGLGAVALRVRGLYFALVTIAYGVFVERAVFGITALTGGGAGANAARPGFAEGDLAYAYVCVAGLVVAWLFDWRLTSSRAGRAIEALRDDERVAASWGINVKGYKLLAFALAGGVAGLAGALFASVEQVVSPLTFALSLALTFVLMTVVGGIRSRPGVVIGGIVFAILPKLLEFAHAAWGEREEAICATAPPDILQLVIYLAVAGAIAERLFHAFRHRSPVRVRVSFVLLGLPIALLALWHSVGGIQGDHCVWATITAEWDPLIGALLLLLTLTMFPGGIAQQFAPIFRWLSFQPLREDRVSTTSGGAAGEGDSDARP